jgi:cystathionine gamma-synthase
MVVPCAPMNDLHLETLAIHAGHRVDPSSGAVISPLVLSTTFERAPDLSFPTGNVYSREANPNRRELEVCLAALEGGADAAAFPSGSSATLAVVASLRAGDHVIAPRDSYHGTRKVLAEKERWGLQATFVDQTDLAAVRAALRPTTKLVWVETPSNPTLTVTDIRALSELAHSAGALCVVDNTWPSPVGQRPLTLGADLVVHSTTKYLGGHSDVSGGAVITGIADEGWARIRAAQTSGGAIPSPFDCWLVLRGIRTLPWRVRAHSANAQAVAEALVRHPKVEHVYYPGLASHPARELIARQMRLPGGMVSVTIKGGRAEAIEVSNRLRLFTRATSLGGVESLVEHRHSIEGPATRAPENLLRLSIGLEHPDDLVADLTLALG